MGILNVTPDSFSDGGRFFDPSLAISHGRRLVEEGAAVIDVGGESTRPGAVPVDKAEEIRRIVPVVEALAGGAVRISIDTTKPEVARAAVAVGATMINDVSATLASTAADCGVAWVAMHRRGTPATMQADPRYGDVVADVAAFLDEKAREARQFGVEEVWIDPGIGFAKTAAHNFALLAHLDRLVGLGWPVLVGTSRKGLLGRVLGASDKRGTVELGAGQTHLASLDLSDPGGFSTEGDDRLEASIATATWAMVHRVSMIRAHDVLATVEAAKVVAA